MSVHLVDGVPFLNSDFFGPGSCLRSHKLLQVSNGVVLTADMTRLQLHAATAEITESAVLSKCRHRGLTCT